MDINTICPVCARDSEDGGHLFFKCKAKQVWNLLALEGKRKQLARLLTAKEVSSQIVGDKEQIAVLMVIILWFLWSNRNAVREEKRGRNAEELARSIRLYANEVSQSSRQSRPAKQQRQVRWHKPPEGYLKLNCDASFISETKAGSWGFLIRDVEGEVVMSGRGRISFALSAFHAELIACMQGVQVACDLGIGNMILETDAVSVQAALQSQGYDVRPEGGLIEELKSFVLLNFSNFKCNFLGRAGNKAAHVLASLGYECVEGEALISSAIPDDISVIISDDSSEE